MLRNKKAQALEGLQNLIIPLIGVGIILVVGFLIIAEARDQVASTDGVFSANCTNTTGYYISTGCNASMITANAMYTIPGWLPIIVITVIGAILIGLVSRFRR